MNRALTHLLDQLVGTVPAASLNVRVDGREVFHHTAGWARLPGPGADPRPATEDLPFDLASVTKVLSGAAVTASLVNEGLLDPDAPVAEHLPSVDPRVTPRHLLAHSAGYPAHIELFRDVSGAWGTQQARDQILHAARTTPLQSAPGEAHCYSDLGYLTLCALVEVVGGHRIDTLFENRVRVTPDVEYGWPMAAATEHCPVRGVLIEGTVHDHNTSAMGGHSTHAGLFGTARGVARLAERLLARPEVRAMWLREGPGSHTGGWDTISPGYSSTGAHFPPDTVGHLGYTGTSVWMSASRSTVVVLLTNRVHPHDTEASKQAIREARPRIHDEVARLLGWA